MRLQWSSTDLRGSEDSSIKRRFLGSCEEGDRGYCEKKMEMVNESIETARVEVKTIQNEVKEKRLRRNRKRNGNV